MGRARTAQKNLQRLASNLTGPDSLRLDRSRFLPRNAAFDEVFVEVALAAGTTAVTLIPVFVRNSDPIDGTETQYFDIEQQLALGPIPPGQTVGALGVFWTFFAKPGYQAGICVVALTGTVTHINAVYATSQ